MSGVYGQFPAALLRCFQKREYAESFLAGKILVRRNSYYRTIESEVRRDSDEGEGFYRKRGLGLTAIVSRDSQKPTEWRQEDRLIEHHVDFGQAVFLLCCSHPNASLEFLREHFGHYIVKLTDPRGLAEDMDAALGRRGVEFMVNGQNVSYSRGKEFPADANEKDLISLAYIQKDERFSPEREFRYCIIGLGHGFDDHTCLDGEMVINLGHPIRGAGFV